MLYLVLWIVLLVLVGVWSTSIFMLHSLLVWSISGAGALAAQANQIETLTLPSWMTALFPPEWLLTFTAALANLLPWLEGALNMLPSAASWLSPLAWVAWAAGLLVLAVGAAIGYALIWTTRQAART